MRLNKAITVLLFLLLSNIYIAKGQPCPSDLVLTVQNYFCNTTNQTYDVTFTIHSAEPLVDDPWYSSDVVANAGTLTAQCNFNYDAGDPNCIYNDPQQWQWICACDGKTYEYNGFANFSACTGLTVVQNSPCTGTYPVQYLLSGVPLGQSVTLSVSVRLALSLPDVFWFPNCEYILTIPAQPGPNAPASVTGPATTCGGATQAYSTGTVVGATSYQWTVPAGATITGGQGTKNITVKWGNTSGQACVAAQNACGASTPTCKNVTVTPAPVVNLASGPTVCGSPNVTLDAGNPGSTYAWSTGATTQTIVAITGGSYRVTVTQNGCSAADTVTVNIQPPIQVTNITTNGLSGTFQVSGGLPQVNGSNYASVAMALQGNPGVTASVTGGPFTQNSAVSFSAPQAGTYDVAVTDGSGCSGSAVVTVMNNAGGGQDTVPPCIEWQRTIGGSGGESIRSIQQTSDGGYILGGSSRSNISGNKTENSQGNWDYWVVKLDALGNTQWQNTIGGSDADILYSLQQTSDGGYILGGESVSDISGDKTENNQASADYWVIKLDALGNIQWQNTIGGSDVEGTPSIKQTSDGGFILGGTTLSNISGDKTENSQGAYDYWVLKLDELGNIQWQNTIGGILLDEFSYIQQTSDGGYILGGYSNSNISGDKTENSQGNWDYWVVKLDALGNIHWQNTIGGSGEDYIPSIQQTSDGGYVLGGLSFSNISGDKSENSQVGDYWVVKLDALGNIQWQNTIGGSGYDDLRSIQQLSGGGYILGGSSFSNISGDKTEDNEGGKDYWVIKLDVLGSIHWQKNIGGSSDDELFSIRQTSDGGYILGGYSSSNISGDKTENSKGQTDYWVIKLAPPSPPTCQSLLTVPSPNSANVPVNTAINWNHTPGCLDGYHLSLSTTPGGSDLLNSQTVQDTFYQPAQPLPAGDTIYVRIVPYNGLGEASGCQEYWFVTAGGAPFTPEMVPVAGGSFIMGCTPEQALYCEPDEKPDHPVTLPDFEIGKYEVTQMEWQALMSDINPMDTPGFPACGGACPIEKVSWYDAVVYCNRLSEQEGLSPCYYSDSNFTQVYGKNASAWSLPNGGAVHWKTAADGYRLPTEAEWEYAARGGIQSQGYLYAGSDIAENVAWIKSNAGDQTHPAGAKPGNELGLFDMSGNVWEWTWDVYDPGYYDVSATCVPTGPGMGPNRVYRGGSWFVSQGARVAYRSGPDAATRVNDYGFRLAKGKVAPDCIAALIEPAHASVNVDTNTLIRWPGPSVCVEGYRLSLGTSPGGSELLDNVTVQDTFYQPSQPLPPGTTVFVRVVPVNGAGSASGCQEYWFVTAGGSVCNRLSDSLELVKFYNSTGGPTTWINKWNLSQPMNTWHGVGLTTQGCVASLFLQDNNLNGPIPDSFGALGSLEAVDMQNNNLSGPLPSTFGNLTNLEVFYIRNNPNISGPLPASLTNCSRLKVLCLALTGVSGNLPSDIDKLTNLNYLLLDETKLGGPLPAGLGSLKEMVALLLNKNQFTGPLPDLSQVSRLELLYLQTNKVDSIPLGAIPSSMAYSGPHDTIITTPSGASFFFGLSKGVFVQDNALTFEDLLPLDPPYFSGSLSFPYSPQDSVFHDTLIALNTGQNFDISLDFDENIGTNTYHWYKDGIFQFDISGDNNLKINNLQVFHAGEWRVQVTNDALPNLTLYSRAIRLQVGCANAPAPVINGPLTLCDGSATLTVSGNYPQSPQWSNSTSGSSTTVNTPGNYTVTVADANGCTGTATRNIGPNAASPQPSITGPTALCGGSPTLSVSGNYPQNPQWSNSQTGYSITVSLAGNYSVTVTDANGCTGTDSQNISNQGPPTIAFNTTPAGCNTSLGSINLTPTGASPFTFQWSDLPGPNDPEDRNNLSAGQYTVTVTDANGCSATSMATVGTNNTPPTVNISASPATATLTCITTSVQLTASGGGTYQWSNGLGTSATVTVTTSDNYIVTVTDGNGCTATATRNVMQNTSLPPAAIQPPTATQLTCSVTSIQLSATGGGSYQWSNGLGNSPIVVVTTPATYTVTVTGGNGCTATATQNITQNITLPGADITVQPQTTELTCTVASITLIASGGGNYQWSSGLGATASVAVNAPGNYTVTITNPANGCSVQKSITITQDADVPVVMLTASPSTTLDCTHPTVMLTATGGGTYQWSNGLGTGSTVTVGASGNYVVTVTLPNDCSNVESISVTQDTVAPTPDIIMNPPGGLGCGGSSVTLAVNGTYSSYLWTGNQSTQNITVSIPGNYAVTVTGPNGCSGTDSQEVASAAVVTVNRTEKLCMNGSLQIGGQTFDKNNPTGQVTLPGLGPDCDTVVNVTLSFYPLAASQSLDITLCPGETYDFNGNMLSQAGNYKDTLFNQADCDSVYLALKLAFKPLPPFAAEADSTEVIAGESVVVPVMDNDAIPPGGGLSVGILTQPARATAALSGANSIEVAVPDVYAEGPDSMLYVLCHNECPDYCDTALVFIRILPSCLTQVQSEIPNAITPNGDGINDEFDPLAAFGSANCTQLGDKSSLVVLNRWGEAVFRPGGYEKWNGSSKSGKILPAGAYYYILRVDAANGEIIVKGSVLLLR